jgi:uncharacterized protein (DUF2252 family)
VRDPLARLIEYNRRFVGDGRDPAWLRVKLDRLCTSPFGFFRGTFHLFMSDWPSLGDDPLGPGAPQPIVGDLHLENFGAFKTHEGLVFDVNDFDETAPFTPAVDLMRLTTSFLLADEKHGELRAASRIEAFLEAYLKAARAGDRTPLTAAANALPRAVTDAIEQAKKMSRGEWLARYVDGAAGARRFRSTAKYHPVTDETVRAQVAEGVAAFCANSGERPDDCPSWGTPIDVAIRIAGTGSLGRFRYAVLMPGEREKANKELVLELKEALPSSLAPDDGANQAVRVAVHQRLLQGASPRFLGATQVGGRAFSVRELQPTDAKLDQSSMSGSERDELCASCGTVLGRLHVRGARDFAARLDGRDRALARRVAAFALRYAEIVDEDCALLQKRRGDVERALGLS